MLDKIVFIKFNYFFQDFTEICLRKYLDKYTKLFLRFEMHIVSNIHILKNDNPSN